MNINWTNIQLIFVREVRDQLRDRRTLFMVAVLPILLYPLMGMSFFQVSQFIQEHPIKVLIVGGEGLPDTPRLFEDQEGHRRFAAPLFHDPQQSRLLEPHFLTIDSGDDDPADVARRQVQEGKYEVAVVFPPDFGDRLGAVREQLLDHNDEPREPQTIDELLSELPSPKVHYNTAREASALAFNRVTGVLERWTAEIGRGNLSAGGVPERAAHPFEVTTNDVARETGHGRAAAWSKVLPFLLLIWALTGAFYPAVDLCAGEKERGTLETLLSSPAQRSEIVVGKLLTIMSFSIATAVLNLISMGIVGQLILSKLPDFGAPPLMAPVWLLLALIPMSALFSAVCLALAAFARSSKEGQYYLMPVLLVTMPLVILPMSPGFELNLGNSLIPVTGVVLLLRSLLEGAPWGQVLPYVPPVTAVTLSCCLLAIRWAVDQFNSESVLFRESERFGLGVWVRHLLRDREDTPNVAAAVSCGVLILMIRFFMSFALPQPDGFRGFVVLALVTQLAVILSPALFMTVMLTRSPRKTLLLSRPALWSVPAAILLAAALHPSVNLVQVAVMRLYPISDEVTRSLNKFFEGPNSLWELLLVVAVVPAICEELAFRGFILSGLRRAGDKWRAIAISSLFFGLAHGIFQQSLIAALVGMVIGYLAVQTGSLLPCALFHMVHNGLAVLTTKVTPDVIEQYPILKSIFRQANESGCLYQPHVVALGGLTALALLCWFRRLPYAHTPEERLHETIDRPEPQPVG